MASLSVWPVTLTALLVFFLVFFCSVSISLPLPTDPSDRQTFSTRNQTLSQNQLMLLQGDILLSNETQSAYGLRGRRESRKNERNSGKKGRHRKRHRVDEIKSHLRRLFVEQNSDRRQLSEERLKFFSEESFKNLQSSPANGRPIVIANANQIRKKKDWCRTEPLKHRITEAGCLPKIVINKYCYGQCNSFYIPLYFDESEVDNGMAASGSSSSISNESSSNSNSTSNFKKAATFKSCAFCKPKTFRYILVRLNCPALTPSFRRKRVQLIEKCRCLSEILET